MSFQELHFYCSSCHFMYAHHYLFYSWLQRVLAVFIHVVVGCIRQWRAFWPDIYVQCAAVGTWRRNFINNQISLWRKNTQSH